MNEEIHFDPGGLIPAVVQDVATGQVLMLAWMNAEALQRTLETGEAHFWSRSRQELWHKGATSGNVQRVVEVRLDCDGDALLLRVNPAGPACHTGETSCFYRVVEAGLSKVVKSSLGQGCNSPRLHQIKTTILIQCVIRTHKFATLAILYVLLFWQTYLLLCGNTHKISV